jgi:hypothetical protein
LIGPPFLLSGAPRRSAIGRRGAAGGILSAADAKKLTQQAHRLVALLAREPAAIPFIRSSLYAAALWGDGDTTRADANGSVGVEPLAVELLATVPIVAVVAVPSDLNIDAFGRF